MKLCFVWNFQSQREKPKNFRGFSKKSSTPPVWFFSGIAHSHMTEPMVTTQCFVVLKSVKASNFNVIAKILEVNLALAVLLQNFYQILRKVVYTVS